VRKKPGLRKMTWYRRMAHPSTKIGIFHLFALSLLAVVVAFTPTTAAPRPELEAIAARQPELLKRALGQLKAPSSQPQLYFVGFAGYGRQSVFKREVLAVRQMFDDRFGTNGRSVALVNHPSTANDIPLADASNLDAVLQHLGKLMNPNRDTLFLFLSSHGIEGRLAVDMPGLALRSLTPHQVKSMLDRAGIRRRIIVISSCHSGSFIPTLADPNTLVIAAARADRSSFGCEDKRRWTYFGDAYFNRALRQETSFRRAFEHARKLVALWEAQQQLIPSLPQMAGGESLSGAD
jgi:Peptidase C13 family